MSLKPPVAPNDPINDLRGVFDVTDYGARGDGSTDDTAAINAARTAARSAGGVVFFPPGTFKYTSSMSVYGSESFRGSGYRTSIVRFVLGSAGPGVTPADSTGFTDFVSFENLALHGNDTNETIGLDMKSCRDWDIVLVELNHFTVSPCQLYGQRTAVGGLNPGDTTYNRFSHVRFLGGVDACRLTGTTGSPSRLNGGTSNMNEFTQCRFASASQHGTFLEQGSSNEFRRCSWVSNGGDGIRVGWYQNRIWGVSENNGGFGITFTTDSETKDNTYDLGDGGSNVAGLRSETNVENNGFVPRGGLRLSQNTAGTGNVGNHTLYNTLGGLRWRDGSGVTQLFVHRKGSVPTVASAASLTLDSQARVQKISGTTTITSIDTTGWTERVVTLIFTSSAQVTDGGNLVLASNFTGAGNRTLTLVCDGTNFYEVARSTN